MFGLAMDGYHYGNLKNMKMSDEIEKMRINKSTGFITLFDYDMNYVTYRRFLSVKQRKEIIELWGRVYKLDDKSYYMVISHD
jgi:hypothetical protein